MLLIIDHTPTVPHLHHHLVPLRSDDLREQVETLKREHKLGMDERAMLKAQRDELSSELGQVKEKIDSQVQHVWG